MTLSSLAMFRSDNSPLPFTNPLYNYRAIYSCQTAVCWIRVIEHPGFLRCSAFNVHPTGPRSAKGGRERNNEIVRNIYYRDLLFDRQMSLERRRLLQLLGGVSVTVLAGCSSSNGDQTPTATTEALPNLESFSYPDGFGAEGVSDTQTAVDSQKGFLAEFSSYTTSLAIQYETDGETTNETTSEIRVDRDERTVAWTYVDHAHDKEIVFVDGNLQMYNRETDETLPPGESALFGGEPPADFAAVSSFHESQMLQNIFRDQGFEVDSVVRSDQGPAVEYSFSGTAQDDYYDSFTGGMTLLEDGGVLSLDWEGTAEKEDSTETSTFTYSVSNLGETVVEMPDWVEN